MPGMIIVAVLAVLLISSAADQWCFIYL